MKKILMAIMLGASALTGSATNYWWNKAVAEGNWSEVTNWCTEKTCTKLSTKVPGLNDAVYFTNTNATRVVIDCEARAQYIYFTDAEDDITLVGGGEGCSLELSVCFKGVTAKHGMTLDGLTLYSANANASEFGNGQTLTLKNGSNITLGKPQFKTKSRLVITGGSKLMSIYDFEGNDASEIAIDGKSTLEVGGSFKFLNEDNVLTLDDSTILAKSHAYFGSGAPGGGTMNFKGASPLFIIMGTSFRPGYNMGTVIKSTVFNFIVPEGGYAQPPVQHLGNTTTASFYGAGNCKAGAKFAVDAASPATMAGTETLTDLMISYSGICGISKTTWCVLDNTNGALSYIDNAGNAATSDTTAKRIHAVVGSGDPAPTPTVDKTALGTVMAPVVNRKTVSLNAMMSPSTTAAKTVARLWVGETAEEFEVGATADVSGLNSISLAWTAPMKCFEKTYYFKLELVDQDAQGETLNAVESTVQSAKTLDTTTYTWTGGGKTSNWGDAANWSDNFGGNSLGYPQSDAARAQFNRGTYTVTLDATRKAGELYFASDVDLTLVNAGTSTNENKTTFKNFVNSTFSGKLTLDGVAIVVNNNISPARGSILKVTNGSDLYCSECYINNPSVEIVVDEASNMCVTHLNVQDGNTDPSIDGVFIIEDATVTVRNNLYLPNNNYGARLRFQGRCPRLRFNNTGAAAYANKNHGQSIIEFLIPEGGYAEPPILANAKSTVPFGNSKVTTAGAANITLAILPESPALYGKEKLSQDLISWNSAGFNASMLVYSNVDTTGTLSVNGTNLVATITPKGYTAGYTVTGYPSELAAEGLVYGFTGGLTEGDTVTLTAPANATGGETMRATCGGWRLYETDPATGSRKQVASGVGTTCSYTHDNKYHEVEWQWKQEFLVTASAGANGTVSAASQWVAYGAKPNLTATPAEGYVFNEWTGGYADGNEFAANPAWAVTNAMTLVASFDEAVYASPDGTSEGDGTKASPYDLAKAITMAGASDTTGKAAVLLAGTYPLDKQLAISTATRIVSESGDYNDVVIRNGKDAKGKDITINGLLKITAAARFSGIAIAGGTPTGSTAGNVIATGATFYNCYVTGITTGKSSMGGAMYLEDGRLTRSLVANNTFSGETTGEGVYVNGSQAKVEYCTITNNYANGYDKTSAVYVDGGATVTRCLISDNWARSPLGHGSGGGGAYIKNGLVEHCLIVRNVTGSGAGGVKLDDTASAILDHCTVAGNSAMEVCGGINTGAKSIVRNCIIWGNVVQRTLNPPAEETSTAAYSYGLNGNCVPQAVGHNALVADPCYRDASNGDYRLSPDSSCRALGYGYAPYDERTLDVTLAPLADTTLVAGEQSFEATATGNLGGLVWSWKVDDLVAGIEGSWTSGTATFTQTFAAGHYRVTVKVTDAANATATFSRSFYAGTSGTVYVVPAGTGGNTPTIPYDTEATAANDVNEAINYCAEGATMLVAPGDYGVTRELYITRGVTVKATGSSDDTSIYRIGQYNSGDSFRVVHLKGDGTVFDGFAVTNGYYQIGYQRLGFNLLNEGGLVKNCRIAYGATFIGQYSSCALALLNGVADHCEIDHNYGAGPYGGGFYVYGPKAVLRNSEVHDHKLTTSGYSYGSAPGGSVDGGTVENCYIHDNVDGYGCSWGGTAGGVKMSNASVLRNCLILRNACGSSNAAGSGGGGVNVQNAGSQIINCTIACNMCGHTATEGVGGGLTVNNCAVTLINNVFYKNSVTRTSPMFGDPDWWWGTEDLSTSAGYQASTIINNVFSCDEHKIGVGAMATDNPRFNNEEIDDFSLGTGSSLIDAGDDWYWTTNDVDLAGSVRIQGKAIDIGCYEKEPTKGITCTIDVDGYGTAGAPITVKVNPIGEDVEGVTVKVTIKSSEGQFDDIVSDWGSTLSRTLQPPFGPFYVLAEIQNGAGESGECAEDPATPHVVAQKTMYVIDPAAMTQDPIYPYSSWETAATNLAQVVSYSGNGTTVWLGPGTHEIASGAIFNGATAVRSVEGPEKTVLRRKGSDVSGNQPYGDKMKMLTFNAEGGLLDGVTMSNGYGLDNEYGAYVYAEGSTITNCVFNKARMYTYNGGAVFNHNGLVTHCIFTNAMVCGGMGGAYYQMGDNAIGEWLTICNNKPAYDFYLYGPCAVGGGVLRNCVITNNNFYGTANGSRVGGIELEAGRVESCLVAFNHAGAGVGGIRVYGTDCEIVNCTVVSNRCCGDSTPTEPRSGGIGIQHNCSAKIINTISWGNQCLTPVAAAKDWNDINTVGTGSGSHGTYTTTTSKIGGEMPKFRAFDPENGKYDFRLLSDADEVNAGTLWEGAKSAFDVTGFKRVNGKYIDIGAYECRAGSGLVLIIR